MKTFLTQFFTWWNGQTLGTRFWTWRKGERVGEDEFGNIYYRAKNTPLGERRWVIFNGPVEGSAIPTGWHGWIHHTTDVSPADENYVAMEWEKPHRANPTGTPNAYHPPGSVRGRTTRETPLGDYQAWTPGG